MKKNMFFSVMLIAILAFVFTGCDNSGSGGSDNGGQVASVADTTWIASFTRTELAQFAYWDGWYNSVEEAYASLVALGLPANFPAARMIFHSSVIARFYEWDIEHGIWVFQPPLFTWSQTGNTLTLMSQTEVDGDYEFWSLDVTIIGNSFAYFTDGMLVTFIRQ